MSTPLPCLQEATREEIIELVEFLARRYQCAEREIASQLWDIKARDGIKAMEESQELKQRIGPVDTPVKHARWLKATSDFTAAMKKCDAADKFHKKYLT